MNSRSLIPFHATAIAVFAGMQMLADVASSERLRFLLRPVNAVVPLLTGASSDWQPELGYYIPSLHIIIDKNCSGIRFLSLPFFTYFQNNAVVANGWQSYTAILKDAASAKYAVFFFFITVVNPYYFRTLKKILIFRPKLCS